MIALQLLRCPLAMAWARVGERGSLSHSRIHPPPLPKSLWSSPQDPSPGPGTIAAKRENLPRQVKRLPEVSTKSCFVHSPEKKSLRTPLTPARLYPSSPSFDFPKGKTRAPRSESVHRRGRMLLRHQGHVKWGLASISPFSYMDPNSNFLNFCLFLVW